MKYFNIQFLKCVFTNQSLYIFILFLFFQTQLRAQYTSIPDTIFEQKLIDLGIDSEGTLDGQLLTSDANGATGTLDLTGLGIENLEGIKDFTSIVRIYGHNNNIDSLDVAGMTNITALQCGGNNMSNLIVAGLTNLTELSCAFNNIDSLDVSTLINLTELTCSFNDITSLDVSNLFNLTELRCSSNDITSLDVSNITNLTLLLCQKNNLTSLAVSNLINLTNLACGVNSITLLEVSNLINLTSLYCERNNITSLDLSQLSNLTKLYCRSNDLNYLNVNNGNNINVTIFDARSNPELECITVDDVAWSIANWTSISAWTSFSADCDALACPSLTSPLHGDTLVEINADVFWNSTFNASGYKLIMGTCSTCTDILDSLDVGDVTTYDPGVFNPGDTIFTNIIPYDSSGQSISCAEEVFYISTRTIECTSLSSPQDGDTYVDTNGELSWFEAPNVDGYKLNVGTCSNCTNILNSHDVGDTTSYDVGTFNVNDTIFVTIIPYDSLGDLTGCYEESFIIDDDVTFSGTIEYPNGTIQYSRLIIVDPITYEAISINDVCSNNNSFSIDMPAGIYNVYYRPFQIGAQPYEVINLNLTSDLDTVLVLEPYTTPEYFEHAYWSQLIAFGEGVDTINLYVEVNDSFTIDSIYVYNEFFELREYSVLEILKFALKDDGLGDDQVANDGIFTSGKITKAAGSYGRGGVLSQAFVAYFQVYQGALPQSYKFLFPSLGLVHPSATSTVPFQQWNDSVFINDQLINIVRGPIDDHVRNGNIVYDIFPDSFDFINIFNTNSSSNKNQHFTISNSVAGIGLNMFDYSSAWGSSGKLVGVSVFPGVRDQPPTSHEVLHQWSNHMEDFFDSGAAPGHNGYSSIDGVHGGLTSFSLVNDTTVQYQYEILYGWADDRIEFADLELYMMGVLDTAELRDEFYRIYDPVYQSTNTYSVSQIDTITPQDIVANYGYRNPPPTATVPIFKTATVVVTSEPLTGAGNMYYSYLAKIWEGSQIDGTLFRNISFDEATGYRADMVTKLPGPFCDQSLTLYTPIESGWYKAANKITIAGNPVNNAIINLDAPNIDFLDISTFGTNAVIETRVKGCGD